MPLKKTKDDNAYHIKLKVTAYPYKPFFLQGIVLAKTEAEAISGAIKSTQEWAIKEATKAQVVLQKSQKLRKDFLIQIKDASDNTNLQQK